MTDLVLTAERPSLEPVLELLGIEAPTRLPGHVQCPRHEDSKPSLCVYDDGHWHAYCCDRGGDAIELVRFATGFSFQQAKAFVEKASQGSAAVVGLARPVERSLVDLTEAFDQAPAGDPADAQRLLDLKWPHLSLSQLTGWGVKIGRYYLLIPHHGPDGAVRGIKTRSIVGGNLGKRYAYPDSCFTTRLYRVVERPSAPVAWLAEGESDTWALSKHFAGRPDIAVYGLPCGAGTWRDHWLDDLKRHRLVKVCFDNDQTGQKALDRNRRRLDVVGIPHEPVRLRDRFKDIGDAYRAGWRPTA